MNMNYRAIKSIFHKIGIVLTFIAAFFALSVIYIIAENLAEPKAYDFMVRNILTQRFPFDHSKNVFGHDDIVLVVIDDKTVGKHRWPLKREKYCQIFNYFNKYASPKAIMYDAIVTTLDHDYPESDKKFFNTINKTNNLTVGFMISGQGWENKNFGEQYEKIFSKKYSLNLKDELPPKYDLYGSILPSPIEYINSAKSMGTVNMYPGGINGNIAFWATDNIFRNHEYLIKFNGKYYPSLALKTFLLIHNNPQIVLKGNSIIFPELNYKVKLTPSLFQIITPMKFYQLYDNNYSHIKYSALDIMNSYDNMLHGKAPIINPEVFKDKIVIIGANVPAGAGLNDNKSSPMINNHPGVDYQATALDNLMHNDFLKVLPEYVNLIITIIGMVLIYLIIRRFSLALSVIFTSGYVLSYLILCILLFYNGIVINTLTPLVMFVISIIAAYTEKYFIENKNKIKVEYAMGKYISDDVMQKVVSNIDNLGLGGKRAIVTVLFSDIRDFTSMSEKMSAQEVSELLNEYFTEMEPIIRKYNGIINKFIGDAIMAVFGEPIQDENHAQNAVKCAYAMLERVKKLRKKWISQGRAGIEIGIGINTGEVFVGNIGSINRMEYTVIGDTVNLASRLESYNKVYKSELLISKAVYNKVKEFTDVIKIPDVHIRGKAHKMDIYEVLKVNIDYPTQ